MFDGSINSPWEAPAVVAAAAAAAALAVFAPAVASPAASAAAALAAARAPHLHEIDAKRSHATSTASLELGAPQSMVVRMSYCCPLPSPAECGLTQNQ